MTKDKCTYEALVYWAKTQTSATHAILVFGMDSYSPDTGVEKKIHARLSHFQSTIQCDLYTWAKNRGSALTYLPSLQLSLGCKRHIIPRRLMSTNKKYFYSTVCLLSGGQSSLKIDYSFNNWNFI